MSRSVSEPTKKKGEKQNIKVVVRSRPLNKQEIDAEAKIIVKCLTHTDIIAKDKRFKFDRVFKPETHQYEVYQHVVSSLIADVLSGYNCTVFAYGQTGTGKTYTMTGAACPLNSWKEDNDAGIIPRAASHVFDLLTSESMKMRSVKISYLELYNEEIRDLLCENELPLTIYCDVKGLPFVQGLTEVNISSSEELYQYLIKGNIKRQTAPTIINHQSSRSHTVFTITVFTNENSANGEFIKTGKINFVDLAGSENIMKSGCKDQRAVELANINRSLLTLGRVIHTLADKNKKHVPYRDSKLTRILQDSLGGHTKTWIIATISPATNSQEETLSTLDYASRARDIKNCPTVNEKVNSKQIIIDLQETIRRLELDLESSRNSVGFYISKDNYTNITSELEALRAANSSLTNKLNEKMKQNAELEEQILAKTREYDDIIEVCQKSKTLLAKSEEEIKKKKISLKKERFLSITYEQEASQVKKEAEELLHTTELLSEHATILQKKLEKQYNINNINERHAHEAVQRVLQVLNEFSRENTDMMNVEDHLLEACRQDITQFKVALRPYLVRLKKVFENFDRSSIVDLPLKQNIMSLLKDFVLITNNQILDMKSKLTEFSINNHQFTNDHVASFPLGVKQVIERFQNAVFVIMRKIHDIFKKEDMQIYDTIRRMQEEVLICQAHNESMLNQMGLLKEILEKRQENKEDILFNEFTELTIQSKTEEDKIIEKFMDAYNKLNTRPIETEALDSMLEETEKFGKTLESETDKIEKSHKRQANLALDVLNKNVMENLHQVKAAVSANYDTISNRLGCIIQDKEQERRVFRKFADTTNQILQDEFLDNVVPAKHEGDTPARVPEFTRRRMNSLAPREVLLQKFKDHHDEDKDDFPWNLNTSNGSNEFPQVFD